MEILLGYCLYNDGGSELLTSRSAKVSPITIESLFEKSAFVLYSLRIWLSKPMRGRTKKSNQSFVFLFADILSKALAKCLLIPRQGSVHKNISMICIYFSAP